MVVYPGWCRRVYIPGVVRRHIPTLGRPGRPLRRGYPSLLRRPERPLRREVLRLLREGPGPGPGPRSIQSLLKRAKREASRPLKPGITGKGRPRGLLSPGNPVKRRPRGLPSLPGPLRRSLEASLASQDPKRRPRTLEAAQDLREARRPKEAKRGQKRL